MPITSIPAFSPQILLSFFLSQLPLNVPDFRRDHLDLNIACASDYPLGMTVFPTENSIHIGVPRIFSCDVQ